MQRQQARSDPAASLNHSGEEAVERGRGKERAADTHQAAANGDDGETQGDRIDTLRLRGMWILAYETDGESKRGVGERVG